MKISKSPRINVVVTEEIISEATREDSSHCMIAEAVKAAVPEARHVAVDLQSIRYSIPSMRARYTFFTPRIGQEALVAFDAGDEIEPFRMQLRNPHITQMSDRPAAQQRQREREEAGLTPEQEAAREAHREVLRKARSRTSSGRRRFTVDSSSKPGPGGSGGQPLPRVEGGSPPPVGPLHGGSRAGHSRVPAGRRRQYGLRAFDRMSAKITETEEE